MRPIGFSIIMSNIGLTVMSCFLYYMGGEFFFKYYLIPYLVSASLLLPTFVYCRLPGCTSL